jgi:hypothetical protein
MGLALFDMVKREATAGAAPAHTGFSDAIRLRTKITVLQIQ